MPPVYIGGILASWLLTYQYVVDVIITLIPHLKGNAFTNTNKEQKSNMVTTNTSNKIFKNIIIPS